MANQEKGSMQSRTASDIELAKGGASYAEGEHRLEATSEQVEAARAEMESDLAKNVETAKEATSGIGYENPTNVQARLDEIADRTAQIKEHLGKIELAVDLKNENYVPRRERAIAQGSAQTAPASLGGARPERAEAKGYYAGTLPTTAPAIQKKKGFFSGLFGGN